MTYLTNKKNYTYVAVNSSTTAQKSFHYDCSGNITITLPASGVSAGEEIRIKNVGTGIITIDPQSQTIDGSTADYILGIQYSSITLVSTGSNWIII